ncbi:MAG: MBL fold metallo-hydrolase [Sphingomonadales bacterium]|nr:MBL fold metallo-hydrolase [Sphingomonadales bacterium]
MQGLEPGIRRIVAPNPSPMTLHGTNSYVIGTGAVAVVDPGPADPGHIAAILAGLAPGERVSHILVTHAHLDHSPGARLLSQATGAPVLAFGRPDAGRSAVMQDLAARGIAGGGEGVDRSFTPDAVLADGEVLAHGDWSVTALHTPGHFCNHLCFAVGDAVLSGDHVMGWASTLISPPDGDLGDYFRALARLDALGARVLYPGHGAPVADPAARIAALAAHRRERSAQILAALAQGPATVAELTARIYTDTPPALMAAAARNVLAHLIEMTLQNEVAPQGALHPEARFAPV